MVPLSNPKTRECRQERLDNSEELLLKFYWNAFPGEESLRRKSNCRYWDLTVNRGEWDGDEEHRAQGVGRFASTRILLMVEMEEKACAVWSAVCHAILDAWVGQIITFLGVHQHPSDKPFFPSTRGRLLLTGKNCPRQIAPHDFPVPHRNDGYRSSPYFVIINGNNHYPLWVNDHSHKYMQEKYWNIIKFENVLKLRKSVIRLKAIFLGYCNLTHAGAGYEDLMTVFPIKIHICMSASMFCMSFERLS